MIARYLLSHQKGARALRLLGLAGLVAASLIGPAGTSSAQTASQAAVGVRTSAQDGVTVAAPRPWTAAEMAAATPMKVQERQGTGTPAGTAAAPTSGGTPGTSAGRAPSGAAPQSGIAPLSILGTGGAEPLSTSYPSPFTRYEYSPKYRTYPISTVGKLFFTQNGTNFVCSASVDGVDTLDTAGHCVNDGAGHWSTNVLFCPSYNQGGVNPAVGCWGADFLATSSDWFSSGDLDRDFGAINVANTGTVWATQIGNVTGWLGFAWNWQRDINYMDFGYPQASPFNGTTIQVCASEFAFTEDGGSGTDSQSIGCDLTGGSSGGPWVWQFSYGGGYINGHNDWRFTSRPLEMNSPYYDTLACQVAQAAGALSGSTC